MSLERADDNFCKNLIQRNAISVAVLKKEHICLKEVAMRNVMKRPWLVLIALIGATTGVLGLARQESTTQPIKIWDAAFYDSEDCRPGPEVEVACPDYMMRIQDKLFTAHIQDECDGQIADSGARKCSIAVEMKFFHDKWGFHDPSMHHHKSMWVDYECYPGMPGSERVRAFGSEVMDTHPKTDVAIICN